MFDSKLLIALLTVLSSSISPASPASPVSPVSTADDEGLRILSSIAFLSSDLLQGRAPGTEGESIAAKYLASDMMSMNLSSITDTNDTPESFIQSVPMRGVNVASSSLKSTLTFTITANDDDDKNNDDDNLVAVYGDTEIHTTDLNVSSVDFSTLQCYFVGYGIVAPELNWDDYKGVSVNSSCVISLGGQPDVEIFNNRSIEQEAITYYARWTYKYEEARRQGAAVALIIHTDETAGYGWDVVLSSNSGEQVSLDEVDENALKLKGWLQTQFADTLAKKMGSATGLDGWFVEGNSVNFKAYQIPTSVSQSTSYSVRSFSGSSVLGYIPPSSSSCTSSSPCESVVILGHLDHLGVRNGAIYAGALDNASGAAMSHALARRVLAERGGEAVPSVRALFVVNPTGEESGLLGSYYATTQFFMKSKAFPANKIVTAIAFDIGNAWGVTSDSVVLGSAKSSLGASFSRAAQQDEVKMTDGLTKDPVPSQGLFYRSDHFAFAKIGVPSVWVTTGTRFLGRPASYYNDTVQNGYFKNQYHKPSDVFSSSIQSSGLVQQVSLVHQVVRDILTGNDTPTCKVTCA